MKYTDTLVGFREVPDEISLCINISNCPHSCRHCHSPELQKDIGKDLTPAELEGLIDSNKGITCVCLLGGDIAPTDISVLGKLIKDKGLKSAWYSGNERLDYRVSTDNFDYIKLGPYIEEFGPLNNKTTNQHFYQVTNNELEDITFRFWK